ncbi:MAG TPA: hypothetical protein PK668_15040 [Myxococcota bacterium]|nr:hypothetical protein [Myxococcota bacterium]HRY94209.1 hypothetical protein [Myxococcota bacterium]HSA20105.1 hypothetical protein [Myxococcota bacterium]
MVAERDQGAGRGWGALTAGDWIGAVIALLTAGGLVLEGALWLPSWEGMFRDFGSSAALPGLTRVVLWTPFAFLAAGLPLAALGLALLPRGRGLAWRRAWIVGGFLLGLAGLGLVEWAVRLPLWQLADAIST